MNKYLANLDRRYVKICAYASVTVILTLVVCMLLYAAAPVVARLWDLIRTVLEPIVYGVAVSYVLNPLVKRVSQMLRQRGLFTADPMHRRRVAVAISVVLVFLALLAITAIFALMVTHSITTLRLEQFQSFLGTARGDFMAMLKAAHGRLVEWGILKQGDGPSPLALVSDAKEVIANVIFTIIFGIYFLIDGPFVLIYLGRLAYVLLGDDIIVNHGHVMADVDKVFSGYFRGQGIDAAVVAVLSGVILTAVGVPFGPLVGLLAGLGNLIPYVGGPVGFGAIALVCLPDAAWGKMIAGFVAMAAIMVIDSNVINPKLLSDNVEVHPILVVAALIAGGTVGGIAGMLVAVPFAAFLKIQLDRWIEHRETTLAAKYSSREQAPRDGSDS